MLKVFRDYPGDKVGRNWVMPASRTLSNIKFQVVYIAPLKALVRERMEDWKVRLGGMESQNVFFYALSN